MFLFCMALNALKYTLSHLKTFYMRDNRMKNNLVNLPYVVMHPINNDSIQASFYDLHFC